MTGTQNLEEGEEVQYKFLLLGSEGNTIEWLPGDNKSFVVPENAGLVEVDDSWTSDPPNVKVLEKAVSGSSARPPPPATTQSLPSSLALPCPTSTLGTTVAERVLLHPLQCQSPRRLHPAVTSRFGDHSDFIERSPQGLRKRF